MGFEVELKHRASDHADLVRRLLALGAKSSPEIDQEDVYLQHPSRDFAQTNEAFRLRRIGDSNRITYKGPRHTGPTKTREEIEVAFQEGPVAYEQLLRLFGNLGFQPVAAVRKQRRLFHLGYRGHSVEVALDVAEDLGAFAEVETYVETEAELTEAQNTVVALSRELGLNDIEPRSYLRMVLERQAGF